MSVISNCPSCTRAETIGCKRLSLAKEGGINPSLLFVWTGLAAEGVGDPPTGQNLVHRGQDHVNRRSDDLLDIIRADGLSVLALDDEPDRGPGFGPAQGIRAAQAVEDEIAGAEIGSRIVVGRADDRADPVLLVETEPVGKKRRAVHTPYTDHDINAGNPAPAEYAANREEAKARREFSASR